MLIRAMEVSGIEGSYRSTCEKTMSVLRDSRDSLIAMLEVIVLIVHESRADSFISFTGIRLRPVN